MEKTTSNYQQQQQEQQMMLMMKCPRCDSSNTKFCYYNNYSLSQPRHFCKACKRYWTRGGTLRNVPVGGGCRKNKKQFVKKQYSQPTTKTTTATTTATTTTSSSDILVSIANPTNTTDTNTNTYSTNSTTVLYGLPTNRSDLGFGRLGFSSGLFNNNDPDSILSTYNNTTSLLNSASSRMGSDLLSCTNNIGSELSYGFQRPNYQQLVEGMQIVGSKEFEKTDHHHHPNKLELWEDNNLHVPNSYCQNQILGQINPISIQSHSSSLYWNPQMTNWLDPSTVDFSNTI